MAVLHNSELTGEIIQAAIEVHRILGPGFLESIYESALCIELQRLNLAFERQKPIRVSYKDRIVGIYKIDMIVQYQVIVELKSVPEFPPISFAQIKSYLKASGLSIGLLFNFNAPILAIKRFVL